MPSQPKQIEQGVDAPGFYEFFAGAGMARAGLGEQWKCLFANDFDFKKCESYERHWGESGLKRADIRSLTAEDLPGHADLAWASFPCQDLSLAGGGAGLRGERSGTFWPFWRLIQALRDERRAPRAVVLENVCGTLSSHGGKDFTTICGALVEGGYRCGVLVIDAALFVPQSRPRLFFLAVRSDVPLSSASTDAPLPNWHTRSVLAAYERLPDHVKDQWVWWNLPVPETRRTRFSDLIQENPTSVTWHTEAQTRRLLSMMSDVNEAKVAKAIKSGRPTVGTLYKRTRRNEKGEKVQRAEVRFDDLAGCLRTPAGGSSRQLILVVNGKSVRSRLISTRETARLMGLPEEYVLPENYNEAYHLTGDGVVVPVVQHIAKHLLAPILGIADKGASVAA